MILHTDKLTPFEVSAALSFFMHSAPQELRERFSQELPLLYNKVIGKDAMEVRHKGLDPVRAIGGGK